MWDSNQPKSGSALQVSRDDEGDVDIVTKAKEGEDFVENFEAVGQDMEVMKSFHQEIADSGGGSLVMPSMSVHHVGSLHFPLPAGGFVHPVRHG